MGERGRLALVVVLAGVGAALASSCAAQDAAREACEEYYERLAACPAIDIAKPDCDNVKASEREHYECLAALEDVCDVESHADC